jgi:hypothetical protein
MVKITIGGKASHSHAAMMSKFIQAAPFVKTTPRGRRVNGEVQEIRHNIYKRRKFGFPAALDNIFVLTPMSGRFVIAERHRLPAPISVAPVEGPSSGSDR